MEKDKIILPRGAIIDEKLSFQKKIISRVDIITVESKLYKGDGLIAKDTYFYMLKLKNGTKITFTIYSFGKEAEKEIIEDDISLLEIAPTIAKLFGLPAEQEWEGKPVF